MMFLPYGRQSIDEDDIAAVANALRGDYLTTGPTVAAFEKSLAQETGASQAVACSNGTTALHLAAMAMEIGPGDAVIVPSLTFLATANAVRYSGAEVIFADVDPNTGMMGVKEAQEALARAGGKAKALFAVHLGGHACDLKGLKNFADQHGLRFLADAAHGLGGVYNGKPVGACEFEEFSTFSFHPVKAIATAEGGAITTNNAKLAEKMRILRSHGMERREDLGPWIYEMRELGYNYRLTDVQCALGLSQLRKLADFILRRKELAEYYDSLLNSLNSVVQIPMRSPNSQSAWHLYSVRIDFDGLGIARAEVMNALKDKGIGSQVHYIPVHSQPYYRARYGDLKLPGAEAYYAKTLSLPLFPAMEEEDVERVLNILREILES
jgi:UDP-4-amino-4,6-dideoxy-N-acetyl-beta-L-altrosamine transaminase